MNITVVSIALCVLGIATSVGANGLRRWADEMGILQSSSPEDLEDCKSYGCDLPYPDKRGTELEEVPDKSRPVSRALAAYRITGRPWPMSCTCETQYDIIDLGLDNYPRYLATAQCTPKPCHNKFNQCRLIHYKVHILKQRDTNLGTDSVEEQYVEQTLLPEFLRLKWQMKPMKIAVACVTNDGKKN